MLVHAHNVLTRFRRFVGLRSAWRRSLALEPVKALRPPQPEPAGECSGTPEAGAHACCPGSCHA